MLQSPPRRKIRDMVVERLKDHIVARQLRPGDRLPTETELAEEFGVSRLSLREATKALEWLGIVESKTGVGLTVGQLELERVTEHLGFYPALHRAPATKLIDTRTAIETGALPFTAARIATDASVADTLQRAADRLVAARELQEWIELDIAFHRSLLEASGLPALVAFNDLLQIFFQRFRESVKRAEWKRGMESHQRLLDALRDQDLARATDELRSHIESHKRPLREAP